MSNGISVAKAYCNDEVAWIAWATDPPGISGCLGFDVVREYLNDAAAVTDERPMATYVAFRGQSNPHWLAQNTTVWPIQRYGWRDLTLRRRRDRPELRPLGSTVRYRIRAVGDLRDGLELEVVVPTDHVDSATRRGGRDYYKGVSRPALSRTGAWGESDAMDGSDLPQPAALRRLLVRAFREGFTVAVFGRFHAQATASTTCI